MSKRHSTTKLGPEFKKKNSEGRSHKHVDGPRHGHSGGDYEGCETAEGMHKGMKPMSPGVKDRQSPRVQQEPKEVGYIREGKLKVERWVAGKSRSYK